MIKYIITSIFIVLSFSESFGQALDLNNAKNIRDPFKVKYRRKFGSKRERREKFKGFSNKLNTSNLRIDQIRVTGIYMGKNPRALIQEVGDNNNGDNKNDVVVIREGMKIGPDQVEVKAILPGGIVLVEKIINVYDEEEYLETILPLSD
ncbi:hypothetical protein [Halobacteriovorax sp. YZS-1-1]|uniref:hypothetical protein n=1 Tax=unclassified Halobacteriovorax TaxID=2639665 RepID=UPI00399B78F8